MIARTSGSGERISTYHIADTQMATGSTIGSPTGVIEIKANGAIKKFYSVDAGEVLISGMQVRFWDDRTGVTLGSLPGEFAIHPDRQEHSYELSNGVVVRETVFILNGQATREKADPPIAYYSVSLENPTRRDVSIASLAAADLKGGTGHDVRVTYDAQRNAFIAANSSTPAFARAFGCSRAPTSWEMTHDHGKCSRPSFPGKLANTIARQGSEFIALLHHHHRLKPGKVSSVTYVLAASANGTRGVRKVYSQAPPLDAALTRTRAHYTNILNRAVVMTPDQDVNRGVLWAKANMLRTQLLTKTGWCFVNDPTRSNNSVGRDTAWFSFGSDYVTPDFSRESLLWYIEHLEKRGMVVEYYDVRTGKAEDYGLNINDNTPLVILALWHHYNATGDEAFLRRVYAPAKKAANYILSQRNGEGLVWCTATGTSDWGIVGWRNVIQGYRLSGATTEVNSECYAALDAMSKIAAKVDRAQDADIFAREARALRSAINTHLLDPDTGLYYLNIDIDGSKRSDVTSDLVFPVMFGVAERETAAHIISRLSMDAFWTEGGIRTVPRDDINYGPTHGYGLLGGVWVGVAFWYAFAAAHFNPDFMASSLSESFRHYSRDPRRNNTVPGQFSEWLHGETLVNQGMMLSPWFPPRYLWAAIEGAAGLDLSGDEPCCNPHMAPDWRWMGVRNLRFRGNYVSWFVVRAGELTMYANFRFGHSMAYEAYDHDITDRLLQITDDEVTAIALERDGEIVVFLGNTASRTVTTSLVFKESLRGAYSMRSFSSLRGEWTSNETTGRKLFDGIPVQIDRGGFCVIELRGKKDG
ncbi:MAG: hypothetical protein M3R51_10805 [Candidatus Eremiobacteraeota bacterium]|nr:hypothetical protein [Candidatus Eremiobacteraeota bacterium]